MDVSSLKGVEGSRIFFGVVLHFFYDLRPVSGTYRGSTEGESELKKRDTSTVLVIASGVVERSPTSLSVSPGAEEARALLPVLYGPSWPLI